MKPPFTIYGGKTGMAPLIVSLMPPHRVYLEPFFGSGAVFFAKPTATHEIINDVDGAVVAFFRMLRDCPADLEESCRLTPYARDEYKAADIDAEGLTDLERARRFWVRVNQGFSKSAGSRTGWSATTARTQSTAASVRGRINRFQACADRLSRASIEHCDGAELVARLATAETVVYADPPYPAGSRVTAGDYRVEMNSEDSHRRLAEVLRSIPATVILSGYPSVLYDELYGDWWYRDLATTAHSSNAVNLARSTRTERLWSNRELTRQDTLLLEEASL